MKNIYITKRYEPSEPEVSWEDILLNFDMKDVFYTRKNTTNQTITRKKEARLITESDIKGTSEKIEWLKHYVKRHADLYAADRKSLYRSYKIPKRSGGLRPIDEPLPPLMSALRELKEEFESWGLFHHAAAYAYIEKRCPINALQVHQRFGSEYYLKTDLTNFFGSTTLDFVMKQMSMIAPFCYIIESDPVLDFDEPGAILDPAAVLKKAVSLAFLNGGLPQGTPISPMLTNLIMIPIDHALAAEFSSRKLVYTRYADDMLISGREQFPWGTMVGLIRKTFAEFGAPYTIKDEKTRYGSRKGSNFNLGLITNANNDITIGYKNKKMFKAMVNNFILDCKHGVEWDLDDIAHMNGLLSYYKNVEKQYFTDLIRRYNEKYNCDFKRMVDQRLYHKI